jgi:hypothetical protein
MNSTQFICNEVVISCTLQLQKPFNLFLAKSWETYLLGNGEMISKSKGKKIVFLGQGGEQTLITSQFISFMGSFQIHAKSIISWVHIV